MGRGRKEFLEALNLGHLRLGQRHPYPFKMDRVFRAFYPNSNLVKLKYPTFYKMLDEMSKIGILIYSDDRLESGPMIPHVDPSPGMAGLVYVGLQDPVQILKEFSKPKPGKSEQSVDISVLRKRLESLGQNIRELSEEFEKVYRMVNGVPFGTESPIIQEIEESDQDEKPEDEESFSENHDGRSTGGIFD